MRKSIQGACLDAIALSACPHAGVVAREIPERPDSHGSGDGPHRCQNATAEIDRVAPRVSDSDVWSMAAAPASATMSPEAVAHVCLPAEFARLMPRTPGAWRSATWQTGGGAVPQQGV
jgi:hypothetical protein